MSNTLQPHELQHARPPHPSGSWWWTGRPGVLRFMGSQRVGYYWLTELNWTCPLSRWRHPTIRYSVILFSSRLQSFLGSGSFPMSQFFVSGGQNIGVSISPSNEYSGLISFRMDWLGLLAVQATLKSLQHHSSRASILWRSAFFIAQLSHPYMTSGKKTIALASLAGDKSLFCIINQY